MAAGGAAVHTSQAADEVINDAGGNLSAVFFSVGGGGHTTAWGSRNHRSLRHLGCNSHFCSGSILFVAPLHLAALWRPWQTHNAVTSAEVVMELDELRFWPVLQPFDHTGPWPTKPTRLGADAARSGLAGEK